MRVDFENAELWPKEFARNNKYQTNKNLRCFPLCSELGHVEQGFCGRPVEFHVTRLTPPMLKEGEIVKQPNLYAWGEFRMVNREASTTTIEFGTRLSQEALEAMTKNTKQPTATDRFLYEGVLGKNQHRNGAKVTFVFNQQRRAWNYNWQAKKATAQSRHTFCVYMFVQRELEMFTCVGAFMSPSFTVQSRHKPALAAGPVPPRTVTEAKRVHVHKEEHLLQVNAIVKRRIELLLPALYAQFAREGEETPDFFQENWRSVPASPSVNDDDDFVLPVKRPMELIDKLAKYLVDEDTLSVSVRGIVNSQLNAEQRRNAIIHTFYNEILHFLSLNSYTECDLDNALQGVSKCSEDDVHVNALVEHFTKAAIIQQSTVAAVVDKEFAKIDITGNWKVGDELIKIMDECRARRGVPLMMRQMISRTERYLQIIHEPNRLVFGIQNKLFSSTSEEFILDGQERPMARVLPVPWSNEALPQETVIAWMDNDTMKQFRTYGGVVRTYIGIRRASVDVMDIEVQYLEHATDTKEWKCLASAKCHATLV